MPHEAHPKNRLELLRDCGIPLSDLDQLRVLQSVQVSIAALDKAVQSSLFDTEPSNFDVVLSKLAKAQRHD